MAAKDTTPRLYELTTRNKFGRETVHRLAATDPDAATDALVEQGIERDHVVNVREYSASA
jgi:hypothetical protein